MQNALFFGFFLTLVFLPSAGRSASLADSEKEYGDAWAELGNWNRAVTHYQKAVQLEPKLVAARLSLANGLYRLGDKQGALQQLSQLKKSAPGSATVSSAVGVIQLDLDQPEKACQSFERALQLDQHHARSLFGTGECHHAVFNKTGGDTEKKLAMEGYQGYLKQFPAGSYAGAAKDSLDRLLYGEAGKVFAEAKEAFAAGKFRLAEKMLRQVVSLRPDLQEAHYLLGMTLASPIINQIEEAGEEWEKAGQIKEALLQRGIMAYEEEDLSEAEDLLNAAIKLDANFAPAYYQLGLVFRNQLKEDQAKESFQKVVALTPGTALADQANSKLQVLSGNVFYLREGEVIDTASEVELGKKITKQMEGTFGLVQDAKLQERLNQILRRIVAHSDRLPGTMPYHIKVLNIDGINALSFIGGTIYIFKGLVDFIQRDLEDSDDVFAAILGHEVVHVVMRHGLGMINLVGGTRTLMEGRALDVRSLNQLMIGMSRIHEFEADHLGCLYAYRAGFDPSAAYTFHRKLISKGQEVPEGMDHPTHTERSAQIKEYLFSLRTKARHFDAGLKALDSSDYESAVVHFEIFIGLFPSSWSARNNLGVAMHRLSLAVNQPQRGYRLSTDIDPRSHIRPIRVRAAASEESSLDRSLMIEAAELFRNISEHNPKYLPAKLNLGSCLLALGKNAKAQRIFDQVLKQFPDSPQAKTNLAVVRLLNQKLEEGIDLLREVNRKHPAFPDAYYNLALALQKTGKQADARQVWLAFLAREKDSGWADAARSHLSELK